MIRVNINYKIIFLALCLLFTFQSATVFSQEQQDKIVNLKEDYRIIRSESNAKIVRADGHDNEKWYMLETKKYISDSLSVDEENSKLLHYSLQKYEDSNSALLKAVRENFSNEVDIAFVSFIISQYGRFEYLYIFLLENDGRKNLTAEYPDKKYYDFLEWLVNNVELTPWEGDIPYCRGAFNIHQNQP